MTTPESFAPGYRLTDGNQLNFRIANPQWSTTSSVSATPGGTMATSAKVVNAVTNITNASAPGAGITLPQALEGTVLLMSNNSSNDVRVFADGDSTINGLNGQIGILLAKGTTGVFVAIATKQWSQLNTTANAGTTIVDTIATLRGYTVRSYGVMFVEGYYAIGDGGDGFFYGVTGAAPGTYVDNGGTIILPSGGNGSSAWLRMVDGEVSCSVFGMMPSQTSAVNDAAFAKLVAWAGPTKTAIYIPGGTYSMAASVSTTYDLVINGDGATSVLDYGTNATFTNGVINVTGSLTALPALSTAYQNNQSVTFSSAPTLSPNDVFIIVNPNDYSFSGFRPYYWAGEFCQVRSQSGTTVNVTNPLYQSYNPGDVDVYKLNAPSVSISNLHVKGIVAGGLIYLLYCRNIHIENVTGYNEGYQLIYLDKCYEFYVTNCNLVNMGGASHPWGASDDYAIVVGNCQHGKIVECDIYSARHPVTLGGGGGVAAVPTRDILTSTCTLKNDVTRGVYSIDFHGNVAYCTYDNCTAYNGAGWGGQNNSITNCRITGSQLGVIVYGTEILGGTFTLENCWLYSDTAPSAAFRGFIDIGGNSNLSINADTIYETTFVVRGCVIELPITAAAPTESLFLYANAGATVPVNIVIEGLDAVAVSNLSAILRTRLDAGSASSNYIIVDKLSRFPNGTPLHLAESGAYMNVPQRMQRQSGRVQLTAASGSNYTVGAPIALRYLYPRTPFGQCTVSSETGQLFNTNVPVLGTLYQLQSDNIRPAIVSGSATNWDATADYFVNWDVGIDDI